MFEKRLLRQSDGRELELCGSASWEWDSHHWMRLEENDEEQKMKRATGSRKQKVQAQGHHDAAEDMSGKKKEQAQIDALGKRPSGMKMMETRTWRKAMATAKESLNELR